MNTNRHEYLWLQLIDQCYLTHLITPLFVTPNAHLVSLLFKKIHKDFVGMIEIV